MGTIHCRSRMLYKALQEYTRPEVLVQNVWPEVFTSKLSVRTMLERHRRRCEL